MDEERLPLLYVYTSYLAKKKEKERKKERNFYTLRAFGDRLFDLIVMRNVNYIHT